MSAIPTVRQATLKMEPIVHLVILSAFLVRAQQLTVLPVRLQVQIRLFWMETHVLSQVPAPLVNIINIQLMFANHVIYQYFVKNVLLYLQNVHTVFQLTIYSTMYVYLFVLINSINRLHQQLEEFALLVTLIVFNVLGLPFHNALHAKFLGSINHLS